MGIITAQGQKMGTGSEHHLIPRGIEILSTKPFIVSISILSEHHLIPRGIEIL